jgi:hypothetical protein
MGLFEHFGAVVRRNHHDNHLSDISSATRADSDFAGARHRVGRLRGGAVSEARRLRGRWRCRGRASARAHGAARASARGRLPLDRRILELVGWSACLDARTLGASPSGATLGAAPLGAWPERLGASRRRVASGLSGEAKKNRPVAGFSWEGRFAPPWVSPQRGPLLRGRMAGRPAPKPLRGAPRSLSKRGALRGAPRSLSKRGASPPRGPSKRLSGRGPSWRGAP